MSEIRIKLEPAEHGNQLCDSTQECQGQEEAFDNHNTKYLTFGDAFEDTPVVRAPSDEAMPTLIPIHEPRRATNTRTPRLQATNQRPASDADLNAFYGVASDVEMLADVRNNKLAAEMVDRKLSTLISNQNKLLVQNDAILRRLDTLCSGQGPRNHVMPGVLNGIPERRSSDVRHEWEAWRDKFLVPPCSRSTNRASPNVIPFSSEEGNEILLGPPPTKLRRTALGEDRRSSEPIGIAPAGNDGNIVLMPPMQPQASAAASSGQQTHAKVGLNAASSSNVLPLYANQCNMAVYVMRAGDQSQMVPIVPMNINHQKPASAEGVNGGMMLSGQPALVYNSDTRQYEQSYVTGIAHPKAVQQKSGSTSDGSTRNNTAESALAKSNKNITIQPNITNIVSLRQESMETATSTVHHQPVVEPRRIENRRNTRSASPPRHSPFIPSRPATPIIIDEDVKPTSLASPEAIMHSQLKRFSMRNYAVQLMRALFRPSELMYRAVYENNERKGIDKKRIQQIKDYVFQLFPTPSNEKSLAWIECISAMNEAIREIKLLS